jgi:hypothetical protein
MDVVSDGSDGDRLPKMTKSILESRYYQPSTSYWWPKQGKTPNPLLAVWEKRLKNATTEYAIKGLSATRNRQLRWQIAEAKARITELKTKSFLVAEYDPFIVLPVFVLTDRSASPYAPRAGDYAVVLHEGKIYPAIVGDAGPNFKVGEASLRIGKQLNKACTPYRRPVSDLKVTYLVFPGTAEKKRVPPNYLLWRTRCNTFLKQIGGMGAGYSLYVWDDILKRQAEERKRKAEEEARKKAEEEARKKAEGEARKTAEAERKKAEQARKKTEAEEEARKAAEAEAAAEAGAVPTPGAPPAPDS